MELSELEGIGPARLETLRAMGIFSLRDLLYSLPVRYEDHHTVFPCNTRQAGPVLLKGVFQEAPKCSFFHGTSRITGSIKDETGSCSVCWINEPWMSQIIQVGKEIRLYGRLTIKNNRRILYNPVISKEDGYWPVYRSLKKIPAKSFRKIVQEALRQVDDCCPETLPEQFRIQNHLCELNFAIRQAHFPDNMYNLEIARRRLIFEQMLLYLLYIAENGKERKPSSSFLLKKNETETYWKSLPFEATEAQKRVLDEILNDLNKPKAMARLVQGDVGCGKTAVAFGAVYLTCISGFQTSMMAPTEILARQHYENARQVLEPLGIRCRLLTGSTRKKERSEILKELISGECQAVFGTHALISKDVIYKKLGLVITDEQHRFGVQQRSSLQTKGQIEESYYPHVLVMTATPIPRTLALILYGDLDISVIDELPKGRIPVKTRLVPEEKRSDMYRFLKKKALEGKQAYVVCASVEDSEEKDEIRSAKSVFEELQENALNGLNLGLTWGEQKSSDKENVFRRFNSGEIQVLISTTVIEVGVNNPNATIMVIENAERFGLSQLHQLRGRVGRGKEESWCFLLSEASEKLSILCATNDGFMISQKDLELRGPGDLTGTQQSGEQIGLLAGGNLLMLEEVSKVVQALIRDTKHPETKKQLLAYANQYFNQSGHEIALN